MQRDEIRTYFIGHNKRIIIIHELYFIESLQLRMACVDEGLLPRAALLAGATMNVIAQHTAVCHCEVLSHIKESHQPKSNWGAAGRKPSTNQVELETQLNNLRFGHSH